MHNTSHLKIISQIRERYPIYWGFCLQFPDFKVKVCTNYHTLYRVLEFYFKLFIIPETSSPQCTITVHQAPVQNFPCEFQYNLPESGKDKIKEAFFELIDGRIIKKINSGLHFIFGTREHLAVGPCLGNTNQVINFINNRFIEYKLARGALLAHAAGIQYKNLGLAISGNSGSGKSTLALQLLNRGFHFTSNDRLLLQKTPSGLDMLGVAKMPRINPGTALNNPVLKGLLSPGEQSRLAQKTPEELWNLEQKYDVPIEKFYRSQRFSLSGPLDCLLVLNWSHTDKTLQLQEFQPRERPELVQMFQKDPGGGYYASPNFDPNQSIQNYFEFLDRIRLFELTGGIDFEEAIKFCFKILESSTTSDIAEKIT